MSGRAQIVGFLVAEGGQERTVRLPGRKQAYPILEPAAAVAYLEKKHLRQLRAPREHFFVITMTVRSEVIRSHVVSAGTLTNTLVHPREVFRPCVADSAYGLIVAHNHPSGDPTPSSEDRSLTARLKEAADLMGFVLHDHVITGSRGSFFSFTAEAKELTRADH